VQGGVVGNSPHKFVWYNVKQDEFASTIKARCGSRILKGRWLFIPLNPVHVLVFGECGGKYSTTGLLEAYEKVSSPRDVRGWTALSATTRMWERWNSTGEEKR